MNAQEFVQALFDASDPGYADFSKALSNSDYVHIGVRFPALKKLVKAHYSDPELRIEEFELGHYIEVDLSYFCIALSRCKDREEQHAFLLENIKYAKSWMVTDTIPPYMKRPTFEAFLPFFLRCYRSKAVYQRRLAFVYAMKFRKDARVLELFQYLPEGDEYMVMMGEAWFLATVAITFPEEVFAWIAKTHDSALREKTISKIVESYRIDDGMKARFKSLRVFD